MTMRFLLQFIGTFFSLSLMALEETNESTKQTETQTMFYPSETFASNANVTNQSLHQEAQKNREAFWGKQAEQLEWFQKWDQVLKWNTPYAEWFVNGKLNACYNCVDRHLTNGNRDKKALIWEGENGKEKTYTYQQLYNEVNRFANVLKELGIQKGDRIAIYLPMIPEAVISMLACARIGAIHTVVFGGFSSDALKDRILDAEAKLLITADGGFRRGQQIHLKEAADQAVQNCQTLKSVLVIRHTNHPVNMHSNRDYWYDEMVKKVDAECTPEPMDSEDLLFILYTSGTTGKPKGIIHTTGGYLLGSMLSMQWVFDVKPTDIYWCTADIGWITGHSYVTYGPLANGMTQFIYEGAPDWPERNRFWSLIEKYKINILYTAPTAIRTFMKWGEEWITKHDLSSLRLLGSVGEPINPEAWMWYFNHIGRKNCPIVDTWWQTETGSIMIAPLPGICPLKPGSATFALPGIDVAILNEKGEDTSYGYLAITSPWPSMLRGIYKDRTRYEETYWKKWDKGYYFTGDGAKQDEESYYWLMGRVDDVISVSGHRLGSMEIESALVDYPAVAEAAAIGINHAIKGQAIVAFVSLKEGVETEDLVVLNK